MITVLKCLFSINHITAPSCSATPTSYLLSGYTTWTCASFNHTALTTAPIYTFGFTNGPGDYTYLDSLSVVDVTAPTVQLLTNPGFDNSTTTLVGWSTWCGSSCSTGTAGQVLANSSCYSGNCYIDHCQGSYDYLAQTFPATIGHNYTLSICIYQTGPTPKSYLSVED